MKLRLLLFTAALLAAALGDASILGMVGMSDGNKF